MTYGSSWDTETGLIDNYDFTIDVATFTTDSRYNDGQTLLLKWDGTATTEDGEALDHTLLLPCGSGWESRDGGKTAMHEKGKTRFNRSSIIGKVIDRCIKDLGMADVLMPRGEPTSASTWEGLSFRMKRESINFGGNIGEKEREMPVAFNGVGGASSNGQHSAPATNAGAKVDTGRVVLDAKVKAIAKDAPDFQTFVDTVISELPELLDHDDIMSKVVEQGGYWSEVHGA